jgi:hypothetical protein
VYGVLRIGVRCSATSKTREQIFSKDHAQSRS